jgi:hypothetical protein
VNWKSVIFPVLLAIAGAGLLLSGSGLELPSWSFVAKDPSAWFVILEESDDRDLDLAVLLQNKPWRDSLVERQVNFRVYDDDQPEAASYAKAIDERPAYLFVSLTGKVLKKGIAPKTAKQADALIAEVIGK